MTRVEVVAGDPTAEELAVVVTVLATAPRTASPPSATPAWRDAALLEGVDTLPVVTPADLRGAARRGR